MHAAIIFMLKVDFFLLLLGIEPKALVMPGKFCTIKLHPQPMVEVLSNIFVFCKLSMMTISFQIYVIFIVYILSNQ